MRRFWIVPAMVVATVGLAASSRHRGRGGQRCASRRVVVQQLHLSVRKVTQSGASVNFSNPQTVTNLYKQAAAGVRYLASNGPKTLRSAFRDLIAPFSQIAKINFSDPTAFSQLEILATPRYQADLHRIAAYFRRNATSRSRRRAPPRRNPRGGGAGSAGTGAQGDRTPSTSGSTSMRPCPHTDPNGHVTTSGRVSLGGVTSTWLGFDSQGAACGSSLTGMTSQWSCVDARPPGASVTPVGLPDARAASVGID